MAQCINAPLGLKAPVATAKETGSSRRHPPRQPKQSQMGATAELVVTGAQPILSGMLQRKLIVLVISLHSHSADPFGIFRAQGIARRVRALCDHGFCRQHQRRYRYGIL